MADHRLDVHLRNTSGLPRDDSVNSLYFSINAPDTLLGVMDDVAAAYAGYGDWIQSVYNGTMQIKAYAISGGPPEESKTYSLTAFGGACPTEVALCLSYQADDDASVAGRRGRIYLPWAAAAVRPSTLAIAAVLDFGDDLAAIGFAGNTTWMMYSRTDATLLKIEATSCDNEWDTQRRRGMRATTRTKRDVQ